jgi:dCMP deaminase
MARSPGKAKDQKTTSRTERPSFDSIYMRFALELSERSTCDRLKVGCVVVSEDNSRVLAIGYNGGARGVFNECLSTEPGKCGHLHAEQNCLIKLDYNEPCKKRMYVTTLPCHACAVAIINARIDEVVYGQEYRSADGMALLERAGVAVRKVQAAHIYDKEE